ncbi:MAG: putative peptidase [Planctomycetota bacterium]|jgi:predicted peptidase
MKSLNVLALLASSVLLFASISTFAELASDDQLLRLSYHSAATEQNREYFVYLPVTYAEDKDKQWPVIFFLHGHGQRGNGREDLDHVLRHGPLMEAWIQRRALPFIIISPQLPLRFGIDGVVEDHSKDPLPARLKEGVPARNYGFKSELPIARTNADEFPDGPHSRFGDYPNFGGWISIDTELLGMLDTVLKDYQTDPERVYLTGISYGGFGTFDLAARYPHRWAAVAPMSGTGKIDDAEKIAKASLPVWMFGGGKDTTIKPHWLYQMAEALESAGHPALRFTVHEDMDHDAWKRAYEGDDLYKWFLRYTKDNRPQ